MGAIEGDLRQVWPLQSAFNDAECVGCNLCVEVCPVEDCITMVRLTKGVDPRTGKKIDPKYANWTTHPNNPMAKVAAE